jgi:hypothetical protein
MKRSLKKYGGRGETILNYENKYKEFIEAKNIDIKASNMVSSIKPSSVKNSQKEINKIKSYLKLYKKIQDEKKTKMIYPKSGNDFLYLYPFAIKKEKIAKIMSNKTSIYLNEKNINKKEILCDYTGIIKSAFVLLGIENAYDNFTKIYELINSQPIKGGKKKIKIQKEKIKKTKKKGGKGEIEKKSLKYLKYQYIFDNIHDFPEKKLFKDLEKITNFTDTLYNQSHIADHDIGLLFTKDEPEIYSDLISGNGEILYKIYYFSLYHMVDPIFKLTKTAKGNPFSKDDIDILKLSLYNFITDRLNFTDNKYLLDGHLNFGSIKDKGLGAFKKRLKEDEKIQQNIIDKIDAEADKYKEITRELNSYLSYNALYTAEQCYDSLNIVPVNILNFFNELKENINVFGYISSLIFSDNINTDIVDVNDTNIFKAFNEESRKLFDVVYYKYNDGFGDKYSCALILKKSSMLFNFFINNEKELAKIKHLTNDNTINHLFNPIINSEKILILKKQEGNNYIYEREEVLTNINKSTTKITPNIYYALDLLFDKGSENLKARNFNSISTIIRYINLLYEKINITDTTISDLINLLVNNNNLNIHRKIEDSEKKSSNAIESKIHIFIFLYTVLSKLNEKNPSLTNKTILTTQIKTELKINIARIFYDLKKASDLSKVLFVYYYNSIKNNKSVLPLPNATIDLKTNFDFIEAKYIKNKLNFSSNDKLTALSCILRKNTSVIYADATNFSICLYNNDTNITYKTLLSWFNIFFVSLFITLKPDVIEQKLFDNLKNIDSRYISYLFKNIPSDKIVFYLNNTDNFDNILSNIETYILDILNGTIKGSSSGIDKLLKTINGYLTNVNGTSQVKTIIQDIAANLTAIKNASNQANPNISYEKIASIYAFTYTQNKMNFKQYEYLKLLTDDPANNNAKEDYEIIKIVELFELLHIVQQLKAKTKQDLKAIINTHILNIFKIYKENVLENIKNNLTINETIIFFVEEIIFNKIDFTNIDKKNKFYLCLYKIAQNILFYINEKTANILNNIIAFVSNNYNLLNQDKLKDLFIKINSVLKIIEFFIFYTKIENRTTDITTIHGAFSKMSIFIESLVNYERNLTNSTKIQLNIYTLLNETSDRRDIHPLELELLGTNYAPRAPLDNASVKANSLFRTIFKHSENIFFITHFNNAFNIFDKLLNDSFKLINDDKTAEYKINAEELINIVKKIYSYSYLQIYSKIFSTDLSNFISSIINVINKLKDKIEARPDITVENKNIIKNIFENNLIPQIETSKNNLELMEKKIKDPNISTVEQYNKISLDEFKEKTASVLTRAYSRSVRPRRMVATTGGTGNSRKRQLTPPPLPSDSPPPLPHGKRPNPPLPSDLPPPLPIEPLNQHIMTNEEKIKVYKSSIRDLKNLLNQKIDNKQLNEQYKKSIIKYRNLIRILNEKSEEKITDKRKNINKISRITSDKIMDRDERKRKLKNIYKNLFLLQEEYNQSNESDKQQIQRQQSKILEEILINLVDDEKEREEMETIDEEGEEGSMEQDEEGEEELMEQDKEGEERSMKIRMNPEYVPSEQAPPLPHGIRPKPKNPNVSFNRQTSIMVTDLKPIYDSKKNKLILDSTILEDIDDKFLFYLDTQLVSTAFIIENKIDRVKILEKSNIKKKLLNIVDYLFSKSLSSPMLP